MKVFISHSAKDKWAARTISETLEKLGARTFLDEKDIKTGDSISDSIQGHLKECDHLLILLSPASVGSHWVLIEVGGALALGKKIVPILFYLGANDIPGPLSKGLARDINEIDKYYDEVRQLISGTQPTKTKQVKKRKLRFEVSDHVRLPAQAQPTATRTGKNINWNLKMGPFLGRVTTVTEIDDDESLRVEADGSKFWWAFEWLENAEP